MKTSLLQEDDNLGIQMGSKEAKNEAPGGAAFKKHFILILFFAVTTLVFCGLFLWGGAHCPSNAPPPSVYNSSDYVTLKEFYENVESHAFTIEDNMRLSRVGAPVISPDGKRIVITVRQAHMGDFAKSTTTLWVLELQKGEAWESTKSIPVQVTRPEWGVSDSSPQWSSDSAFILFLSNRPGLVQLHQISCPITFSKNSGYITPKRLTTFPISIDNILLSPTMDLIAISALVYAGKSMQETVEFDLAKDAFGADYKTFDRLYMRHWDTWVEKRNQPFVIAISFSFSSGFSLLSEPVNILNVDTDAPTRPYGGAEEWSFSPNGKHFVFCRIFDEHKNSSWGTNSDVWMVSFSKISPKPAIARTLDLTAHNYARDTLPRFSPNGEWLAFLAHEVMGYESDRLQIRLLETSSLFNDLDMKEVPASRSLTSDWTLSVDDILWSHSAHPSLFALVLNNASVTLRSIDVNKGEFEELIANGSVSGVSQARSGELIFVQSTWVTPPEVYVLGSTKEMLQLTSFNQAALNKAKRTNDFKRITFIGSNNDLICGWVATPVGFSQDRKYPVAFLIHGGPQGSWESGWSWRWNPQVYAGQGYGVIMIDPHGSTGYGQQFTDSIKGRYGSWPYDDLLIGYDQILGSHDWMNRSAVAALGASYGGYMIYWFAGHDEVHSRFRCLVAHDGMFDVKMLYYATEELYFPEHDMPGKPWDNNGSAYDVFNPATPSLVANWRLPHLVIHGGLDYRIADTQGIAAFTVLQRQGIPSKFLYFPNENHWVLKPRNQLVWHREVFDWLNTFTR